MIERATACLTSGARDSLRCAQRLPRSKRALHSAFWIHGACDLDLLPWTNSHLDHDSHPSIEHGSTRSIAPAQGATENYKLNADSIFLDFLYPPQALAWFRSSRRSCWEKRERRDIRGPPERVIQSSRGYASKSYQKIRGPRYSEEFMNILRKKRNTNATGDQEDSTHEIEDDAFSLGALADSIGRSQSSPPTSRSHHDGVIDDIQRGDDEQDSEVIQDVVLSSHAELLRVLTRPCSEEQVQKAWRLYSNFDEKDKEDLRLKTELLSWMSKAQSKVADAHSISLYLSIPLHARSLAIYLAALEAFLRRKDYDFATALQKEALTNIENGYSISPIIFDHAVRRERWDLALDVMNHHMEASSGANNDRLEKLFWLSTDRIPHIVARCSALIRTMSRRQHQGEDVARYRPLTDRLSHEALLQYLQHAYPEFPKEATNKDVQLLFRHLYRSGQIAPQFLQDTLVSMLANPLTDMQKRSVREMVYTVYLLLRQSNPGALREDILLDLLGKFTFFAAGARDISLGPASPLDDIVEDWKKLHGKVSIKGINRLLAFHAYVGNVRKFQQVLDYMLETHPDPDDHVHAFSSSIYLHARRGDLKAAREAFETLSQQLQKSGREADERAWNSLLYAHYRVDDIAGGFSVLADLLDRDKLKLSPISFQPIMMMLARRGDVEGIEYLMEVFDNRVAGKKRSLGFSSTKMAALINVGEIESARNELREAIARVRRDESRGSLSPHFNILLTAYALRREIAMVMQTYNWMKDEGIRADAFTYAALLQALVQVRKTETAYRILFTVMPDQGIRPQAFHYAIVMVGFHRARQYDRAVKVHKLMVQNNVKDSLSTKMAHMNAKMKLEDQSTPNTSPTGEAVPLATVQAAIQEVIEWHDEQDLAPKEPGLGYESYQYHDKIALYLTPIIRIYGRRRCFEAIESLFGMYQERVRQHDGHVGPPPLELLAALMSSHLHAEEFAEVEACWHLAKEQGQFQATPAAIPEFKLHQEASADDGSPATMSESTDANLAEIGFEPKFRGDEIVPEEDTVVRNRKTTPKGLIPTRRHILSAPLRVYIKALGKQSREVDAVTVVVKLLSQGWVLDNRTWNSFITMLCKASPPLGLSAFTFTERFLIPNFPGWVDARRLRRRPQRSAPGLEYIRARYLRRHQALPQYKTMVYLASVLLQLRRMEATSGHAHAQGLSRESARFVGDLRTIRERAPKTLYAVQSMPTIYDGLQDELLHSRV